VAKLRTSVVQTCLTSLLVRIASLGCCSYASCQACWQPVRRHHCASSHRQACDAVVQIKPFCDDGLVNAIGGCCGSTASHIAAIKQMAARFPPRPRHGVEHIMRLSGLEPLNYRPDASNMRKTFLKIGERCNVAGSIMYKKAVVDGNYDKAAAIAVKQVRTLLFALACAPRGVPDAASSQSLFLLVAEGANLDGTRLGVAPICAAGRASSEEQHASARRMELSRCNTRSRVVRVWLQVEQGADLLDINMDDGLIDGVPAMTKFVNLLVSDPEVSRVPFMIDSSKFFIVEAGLKCSQVRSHIACVAAAPACASTPPVFTLAQGAALLLESGLITAAWRAQHTSNSARACALCRCCCCHARTCSAAASRTGGARAAQQAAGKAARSLPVRARRCCRRLLCNRTLVVTYGKAEQRRRGSPTFAPVPVSSELCGSTGSSCRMSACNTLIETGHCKPRFSRAAILTIRNMQYVAPCSPEHHSLCQSRCEQHQSCRANISLAACCGLAAPSQHTCASNTGAFACRASAS
jgi:Pterin binding enzyme